MARFHTDRTSPIGVWEYQFIPFTDPKDPSIGFQTKITRLGLEGWEGFAVDQYGMYFKRPLGSK